MSSVINRPSPPEAGKEPTPGIVQHYKEHLQALGYCPVLTNQCTRTALHLIT